jgi:hypothetical protein
MIKTFEQFTYELTDKEKEILPVLINGFKFYNKNNPIKEPEIVRKFNERNGNLKLSGVRLRKLVNHIRANSLLPLIATSKGYFVCYDKSIITTQIESLEQRANSINNCANGLKKLLSQL